jgi:hypothetical protein
MATDQIKMNGAAFVRSFVLSTSIDEFVQWGVDHYFYYQHPDKQIKMLSEVWNIANGKKEVYKPVKRVDVLPKLITVKKKQAKKAK